nr:MAG TPA: hypothetical protein [Caudoviricetes sp.]
MLYCIFASLSIIILIYFYKYIDISIFLCYICVIK